MLAVPLAAADAHAALALPYWSAAPFALLLLAIAVLPLVAEHWWHKNSAKALVALLLALPVAVYLVNVGDKHLLWTFHPLVADRVAGLPDGIKDALSRHGTHALLHEVGQYLSFIVLLGALYTVSGGIVVRGGPNGGPVVNLIFLIFGAVIANIIGTTGASVLLIRPVLRLNAWRTRRLHIPIFFIFIVSNLGGLLTPLGDLPLFLGFLNGIDFFWTTRLWPQWLVANGCILTIFLLWDTVARIRDQRAGVRPPEVPTVPLRVEGLVNVVFLAGILAAVLLQSEKVADGVRAFLGQYFPCPALKLEPPWGEAVMLGMAFLSLLLTSRRAREANGFTWGPIVEVAVLFAGIFVTMVPALELLRGHGQELKDLGLKEPWQYFWLTGSLSSFLDNAPTYLTFATLAASPGELGDLPVTAPQLLAAVSCGAVFMGANTYIGNGPNFMVKAIAEEAGYKMPSFLVYLLYSGFLLLPTFGLITYLFFLG